MGIVPDLRGSEGPVDVFRKTRQPVDVATSGPDTTHRPYKPVSRLPESVPTVSRDAPQVGSTLPDFGSTGGVRGGTRGSHVGY